VSRPSLNDEEDFDESGPPAKEQNEASVPLIYPGERDSEDRVSIHVGEPERSDSLLADGEGDESILLDRQNVAAGRKCKCTAFTAIYVATAVVLLWTILNLVYWQHNPDVYADGTRLYCCENYKEYRNGTVYDGSYYITTNNSTCVNPSNTNNLKYRIQSDGIVDLYFMVNFFVGVYYLLGLFAFYKI